MESEIISVRDINKIFTGENRICLHERDDQIFQTKICIHNFQCMNCPFDQWIEDVRKNHKVNAISESPKYFQN